MVDRSPNTPPWILYVPDIALEKIFSFMTYDEIAKNRIVCKKFNEVGSRMLSRGFIQLEKRHSTIYKRVRSLLPRRESERRVHPLSRHCDILQAVETRISMLNMTYMKYIENNLLCFIPGKVLDEMINVLSLVESDFTPPRTHQLLQELRDLSSMAMEHFDEHILPRVKEQKEQLDQSRSLLAPFAAGTSTHSSLKHVGPLFVQQASDVQKIKKQFTFAKHCITVVHQNTKKLAEKGKKQSARIKIQSARIREQERKIQEQSAKIEEQESALTDIKKHLEEWEQKYKDLTTELVRAKNDILLKATSVASGGKLAASPVAASHLLPSSKSFRPSIKPRMAQILPKSYANSLHLHNLERKRKSSLLPDIPLKLSRKDHEDSQNNSSATIAQLRNREIGNSSDAQQQSIPAATTSKSNFSLLIENLIKTPLTSIKSRKRKMAEEIDLK